MLGFFVLFYNIGLCYMWTMNLSSAHSDVGDRFFPSPVGSQVQPLSRSGALEQGTVVTQCVNKVGGKSGNSPTAKLIS